MIIIKMNYEVRTFRDRVEFYFNGKLNDITINGKVIPAIEYADGSKEYYKDGKPHRDNDPVLGSMPAIEHSGGGKEYYKDGKRHRDNDPVLGSMPAIEFADGSKLYYKDGKRHRDDDPELGPMPAIERANGTKEYYKDGIQFYPDIKPKPKNDTKFRLIKLRDELNHIIESLN